MSGNTRGKIFNEKILANWNANFEKLADYKEQFGNCDVPVSWKQDKALAQWVRVQRKTKNKLPSDLKKRLVDLGFDFTEAVFPWDKMYGELRQFSELNGHIYLPVDDRKFDALKDWLLQQIRNKAYLSKDHFRKLEALGVDWEHKTLRSHRWQEMYRHLEAFKKQHGHCRVPQKWPEDLRLANWVCVQRRMKGQGKLSAERNSKLNKLGFVWNFKEVYDNHWEHYYNLLLKFKEEHGHCKVPGKYKSLASWVDRQRTSNTNGKLSKERKKALNKIGFIWDFKKINEKIWQEKYRQLVRFKKKHGHCFVSVNYKENKPLGHWVATQRNLETTGKLDPEKKEKLEKLGFIWKRNIQKELYASYESKWQENFKKLKAYQQEHGTCQVSLKIDPALQRWVCLQRRLYNIGKLSEKRISRLDKMGFPWDINEAYWEKMYKALVRFHGRYGHTRVPWAWPKNPQLATWIHTMKLNSRQLDQEKLKRLQDLDFDWTVRERTVIPWEEMYHRLLAFKQKNGHTKVPVQWEEDPKLGKWVSRMRSDKMNLSRERIDLLNMIDFFWGHKHVTAPHYRKSA